MMMLSPLHPLGVRTQSETWTGLDFAKSKLNFELEKLDSKGPGKLLHAWLNEHITVHKNLDTSSLSPPTKRRFHE